MTVPVKRYQNSLLARMLLFLTIKKAVKHILEPVYNILRVKLHYPPLCPFIAELGEKNLLFGYVMVGH